MSNTSRVRWDKEVLVWKQQHPVKVVMPFCGKRVTNGCNWEETHGWHQEKGLAVNSLTALY